MYFFSCLLLKTCDEHLSRIYNNWIKQQALFGAAWARWGWNGYRDIVQQGMGVAAIKHERTREILLEARVSPFYGLLDIVSIIVF